MSDTKKIIHAPIDEIVEAVMPLYHRYDGENKCTLEKTSHELGNDEPMECSCDYTHRLRNALERFVVEEEDATDIDAWNSALDEMNNTTPTKKGGDDEG